MSTKLSDENPLIFEVLSKLRNLTSEISHTIITDEKQKDTIFRLWDDYFFKIPGDEHFSKPRSSRLLNIQLYDNPYRKLHMYLQGAEINENAIAIEEPKKDESFLEIQKNVLKLQMGLLVYADASSKVLRYLYGPQDLPEDQEPQKSPPHFYIKPFYCREKKEGQGEYEFIELDEISFWEHSRTFYYGRKEANYLKLDFVQILQSTKGSEYWDRRTKFEQDLNIIYAPSGELDACILSWLLMCIDNNDAKELEAALSKLSKTDTKTDLKNIKFKIELGKHAVYKEQADQKKEKLEPWGSGQRKENLFFWMYRLGLITEIEPEKADITERGCRLIEWLELYLRSLGGNELNILGQTEPTFYRLIKSVPKISVSDIEEGKWLDFIKEFHIPGKKNEESLLSGAYMSFEKSLKTQILSFLESNKKEPDKVLKDKIIEELNRILKDSNFCEKYIENFKFSDKVYTLLEKIREPYCRNRLFLEARFPGYFKEMSKSSPDFPSWLDGIDKKIVKHFLKQTTSKNQSDIIDLLRIAHIFLKWRGSNGDDVTFKERCRFNLLGHLTLRAGWESQKRIETASRAWIVFPVHFDHVEIENRKVLTSVGFFLGTFKDSTDKGEGYFEKFHDKEIGAELKKIVSRIQQVIGILATVENREIYMKEIYNVHIQNAIEKQHKWTIHEIRNSISTIKNYTLEFDEEDFEKNRHQVYRKYVELKGNYAEFEKVLHWVNKLMNSEVCEGDVKWVNSIELYQQAFYPNVIRFLETEDITDINEDFLYDNHEDVFSFPNFQGEIEIPFFTYKNLLQELSKNILKYADRTKKCFFNFTLNENLLIIETKNTYKKNKTNMISTGMGLEAFEKFIKVYNKNSKIDRSGLINNKVGAQCVCKVKIAIRQRR